MIKSYEDLLVWQKAMNLVEEVYKLIRVLPKEENFGITMQMRRAAVSIPSNIAEGQSRRTTKEFINFLSIANGSKAELSTQIQICIRLGYITELQADESIKLCEEVSKMLFALITKLQDEKIHTDH